MTNRIKPSSELIGLKRFIQEAVELAILEDKFNPTILNSPNTPDPDSKIDYVIDVARLRYLNEGSSRAVFVIDSKRVLKIAKNEKGFAQNEMELKVFQDASTAPVVTRILLNAPDFSWLVSEIVRPLTSEDEFQQLSGVPFILVRTIFNFNDKYRDMQKSVQATRNRFALNKQQFPESTVFGDIHERMDEYLATPFIKQISMAFSDANLKLLAADLRVLQHWGKTPDQRVVLLDSGYSEEVANAHY